MYKIDYWVSFYPKGGLDPCKIEGLKAVVTYTDVKDDRVAGQIVSITGQQIARARCQIRGRHWKSLISGFRLRTIPRVSLSYHLPPGNLTRPACYRTT